MSCCASTDLCQSLQMVDRKTEYVLEANIPCDKCQNIQLDLSNGQLNLGVLPRDASHVVPLHSWAIEGGVHVEGMTAEYKNGTLFVRLPKSETQSDRPLQYSETLEITPICQ
ncbi:MAG: Hsp20/alpha crystallin family protein [Planctomycetia bacterium]|nr:Hsp20/alpha crystallin family protein [Planctomycetia bacterium]